MTLLILVGTTPFGWDEFVRSADAAAAANRITGLAQIGNGSFKPTHVRWVEFLPHAEVLREMSAAQLVICHGGLGTMGDGLRHARRLLVVPRSRGVGRRGRAEAPNDQFPVANRLALRYGFECASLEDLPAAVARTLAAPARKLLTTQISATPIVDRWLRNEGLNF